MCIYFCDFIYLFVIFYPHSSYLYHTSLRWPAVWWSPPKQLTLCAEFLTNEGVIPPAVNGGPGAGESSEDWALPYICLGYNIFMHQKIYRF
jgi:hypothetical protein